MTLNSTGSPQLYSQVELRCPCIINNLLVFRPSYTREGPGAIRRVDFRIIFAFTVGFHRGRQPGANGIVAGVGPAGRRKWQGPGDPQERPSGTILTNAPVRGACGSAVATIPLIVDRLRALDHHGRWVRAANSCQGEHRGVCICRTRERQRGACEEIRLSESRRLPPNAIREGRTGQTRMWRHQSGACVWCVIQRGASASERIDAEAEAEAA